MKIQFVSQKTLVCFLNKNISFFSAELKKKMLRALLWLSTARVIGLHA